MTNLDELYARQQALETANETLHDAFKTVDGDAHTALQLARQNIKLMTALRETQLAHGRVIAGLVTEVADVKTDVAVLKTDVAGLKTEFAELKIEVSGQLGTLHGDFGEIKVGLAEVLRRLPA